MSRQRAKHLVEITKKEEYSFTSVDKNTERELHTVERGLEYTTSKGKTKAARSMKASCEKCRLQCYNKIGYEVRVDLFDKFWRTGDHAKQWEIIAKYVIQKSKKTATNVESESSRRSHTLHYHLPIKSDNGIRLQKVCKTMFLNTFDISKDFVYTAIRKIQEINDFTDVTDDRGRHKNHKHVISNEMKQCHRSR
ncbi:hypothetical protein HF086_009098 [Spodoptera exigua]|uniref:Uncharacterized protein n=1 Tax=Spodoptera exigua TaxID=7107 RepID=A0A922MND4_SPOEX|nr:hypothetical protein HF086_009098 [Spodoptera exigua]